MRKREEKFSRRKKLKIQILIQTVRTQQTRVATAKDGVKVPDQPCL
jgi:hypothetical protein